MDKQPIIFITGNMGKLKWTKRYIKYPMTHQKLPVTEIQSLDMEEVVTHKVKEAYKLLKKPVMIEDTSLTFHALGKLPGTLIKWFLDELGNKGLCDLLTNKERSATATVIYGFYDGKTLKICKGETKGKISNEPKGKNGFGWDPIFIPDGQTKTHGEMTPEELDKINCRRTAAEELNDFLHSYEN